MIEDHLYYKGKPVEELSREELIEALYRAHDLYLERSSVIVELMDKVVA